MSMSKWVSESDPSSVGDELESGAEGASRPASQSASQPA